MSKEIHPSLDYGTVDAVLPGDPIDPNEDQAAHEKSHKLLRWIWQDNSGGHRGVTTRFYAALYLVEKRYCQTYTTSEFARMAGVRRQALDHQVSHLRSSALASMTAQDIQRAKTTRRRA
jgi:hypothetical protein